MEPSATGKPDLKNSTRSRLLYSGLGAAAVWVLTAVVWGLRFETNDDLGFSFLMMGQPHLPPQSEFYIFYRGLGSALSALHQWLGPSAYGLFHLTVLWLGTTRLLFVFATDLERLPGRSRRCFAMSALCIALMITFHKWNFTRTAFLAVFSASYGIASRQSKNLLSAWNLFDLLLMFIGYAIRPQSGLLAMAVVIMFRICSGLPFRELGRLLLATACVVGAITLHDVLTSTEQIREYQNRIKYASIFIEHGPEAITATDQATKDRREYICLWFHFDNAIYNSSFLAEHVRVDPGLLYARIRDLYSRMMRLAGIIVRPLASLFILFGFLALLLLRQPGYSLRWLTKCVGVLAVMVIIDLLLQSKARVVEPLLGAMAFETVRDSYPYLEQVRERWLARFSAGFLVTVLLFHGIIHWDERMEFRKNSEETRHIVSVLDRELEGKTVLVTLGTTFHHVFYQNDPFTPAFPSGTYTFLPLQGWASQFADYQKSVNKLGNGNGVEGLLESIHQHPDKFAMIGGEPNMTYFQNYVRIFYRRDLQYTQEEVDDVKFYSITVSGENEPEVASARDKKKLQ